MELTSKRMILRKLTHGNYDDYAQWYQNEQITAYITGRALTEEETKTRFNQVLIDNQIHDQLGWFAVMHKKNSLFIGIGKLVPKNESLIEIGYGLIPTYWNAGYGTEMTQCLLNHISQFNFVQTITAIAFPENRASIRILEKFDFSLHAKGIDEQGKPSAEYRKYINR